MAIPKVFVRSAYNYDADLVSQETGLECKDKSLAVQSHRDEADINTIVDRFMKTGKFPEDVRAPTFADFEDIVTFQDAQNAVALARDSFLQMPADVRARFDNDPALFVGFCSDPKNLDEMRSMGLAVPSQVEVAAASGGAPAPSGAVPS